MEYRWRYVLLEDPKCISRRKKKERCSRLTPPEIWRSNAYGIEMETGDLSSSTLEDGAFQHKMSGMSRARCEAVRGMSEACENR
jgi:hypothetical protein